jgi:hypothetical protein
VPWCAVFTREYVTVAGPGVSPVAGSFKLLLTLPTKARDISGMTSSRRQVVVRSTHSETAHFQRARASASPATIGNGPTNGAGDPVREHPEEHGPLALKAYRRSLPDKAGGMAARLRRRWGRVVASGKHDE